MYEVNPYIVSAVAALLTAVVSAVVMYAIAKQQASGQIETSTAADLWAASEDIRKTMKEQNEQLVKELEASRNIRIQLQAEFEQVKVDAVKAAAAQRGCEIEIGQLKAENEMLRTSAIALAQRINELETKAVSMIPGGITMPPNGGNGGKKEGTP